jgi:hypothetical protein
MTGATESKMIKAGSRQFRFAAFTLLVMLVALLPITSALAQEPGLGHAFYGTVKIDGQDAQAGTVISARVGGVVYGTFTVATAGLYGLLVQGEIAEQATVLLYVDGRSADQSFAYRDGWTTELHLTAPLSNGEDPDPDLGPDPDPEPGPDPDPHPDPDPDPDPGPDPDPDPDPEPNPYPFPYPFPFPFPLPLPLPSEFPFDCFIATAAYGSPAAEQIAVLRDFRDEVLMESSTGSQFVALYYRFSPPVADFLAANGFVRAVVRDLLVEPLVRAIEATGGIWRQ